MDVGVVLLPFPVYEIEIETWRPIPGLKHYEASSFGRIRSLDQTIPMRGRWGKICRQITGRVLRLNPRKNANGDTYWNFSCGRGATASASRSICAAFHGPAPSRDHEAAHLDGNTNNNRPPNLCWATPLENADHKRQHGTIAAGRRNAGAKLTEEDVLAIRAAGDAKESVRSIARRFKISYSAAQRITSRKGWTCLGEQLQ